MERFSWEYCAVLFICSCVIALEAEQPNVDHQLINSGGNQDLWYIRKKPNTFVSSMMGRKKRSLAYEDSYKIPAIEKGSLSALMDAAVEPPWAVLTFNEGKRQTVNFTPRLGRESTEESEIEAWLRSSGFNKNMMNQRSPPFAPRLGRRSNTYYVDSRLGKPNSPQQLQ